MYNIKYNSDNGKSVNFSPMLGWAISNITGLTENYVEFTKTGGAFQKGQSIRGRSVQDKAITIEGQILGESALFREHLVNTIVPEVSGELVFNNKIFIKVEPENTPYVTNHPTAASFQFQLRAPYPYWRDVRETITVISGLQPNFSFPINYGEPTTHRFGTTVNASHINVINRGNVDARFKIVFRANGNVVNPQVYNINTGDAIKIRKTMAAGEVLIIDMSGSTFKVTSETESVSENAFRYFDINSALFPLYPGDNLIRHDAQSGRNNLLCEIWHRSTYAGATGDGKTYI